MSRHWINREPPPKGRHKTHVSVMHERQTQASKRWRLISRLRRRDVADSDPEMPGYLLQRRIMTIPLYMILTAGAVILIRSVTQ